MRVSRVRILTMLCVLATIAMVLPAWSEIFIDFESGRGMDGQPVSSFFPGVSFNTTSGGDVLFADITTGAYSATSDSGSHYGLGDYFVAGNVAAYTETSDPAVVQFTMGNASYVKLGYSSTSTFYLDAFDSAGSLLDSVQGGPNTNSTGGSGLAYLQVSHPGIAYVQVHDTGSFWLIDNLSTDAPLPEPASATVIIIGMVGLALRRKNRVS